MHDNAPTVYLLAGSANVDARTYANLLAARGVIRLEPADRDRYKRLVEEHGGQWCVIHFSDDHLGTVLRLREGTL